MLTSQNHNQFPPLLNIDDLARLIHKKTSTILVDRVRRPETLPPDCTPDGQKAPIWRLETVLEWYSSHQKPAIQQPRSSVPNDLKSNRGAPTVAERVAARKAGLSVSEFRRAKGCL